MTPVGQFFGSTKMIGLGPDDEGVALRAAMLHTIGPRTTTIIEMAVHLVE